MDAPHQQFWDTWQPWHTDCDPIRTGHTPATSRPRPAAGAGWGVDTGCLETRTLSRHRWACERAHHVDLPEMRPAHITLSGAHTGVPKATEERQASHARPASAQSGGSEAQPSCRVGEKGGLFPVPGGSRSLREQPQATGHLCPESRCHTAQPGPSHAPPPEAKLLELRLRGASRRKLHRSRGLVSRTHTELLRLDTDTDDSLKHARHKRRDFKHTQTARRP